MTKKAKKSLPQARKETIQTRQGIKMGAGTLRPNEAALTVKVTKPAKAKKPQNVPTKEVITKMRKSRGTRKPDLERQHRFADEYLVDFNATQAAIRAGYSEKTAGQIGFEQLKRPEIQAIIKAKQKELAHKSGITRERIIEETARLAFSDLRAIFDGHGNLKPLKDLDDKTAAAISSVELIVTGSGDDVLMTKKIKLWDKNSALDKLLKHLGLDNNDDPIQALMAAIQGAGNGGRLAPKG